MSKIITAVLGLLLVALPAEKIYAASMDSLGNLQLPLTPSTATSSGGSVDRSFADRFSDTLNVKDFGAKCDGSTDDTTAFNNALTYAGTAQSLGGGHLKVLIPGKECKISGVISIPAAVTLEGAGIWATYLDFSPTSQILFQKGDSAAVSGASVQNLAIQYVAGNPGSSALTTIDMATNLPMQASIRYVSIENAYKAIAIAGNSQTIDHVNIRSNHYYGIMVGQNTTKAGTVDPRITNTTIEGADADENTGLIVYDAGGLYLENNDILYGQYGTVFSPGKNQVISWTFASNTVFGDTTHSHAFYIDPTDSTAVVEGIKIINSWASPNGGGTAIDIADHTDTLTPVVDDINISGMSIYGSGLDSVHVGTSSATHFKFTNSSICAGASAYTAVYVGKGVTGVDVSHNTIPSTCGTHTTNHSIGINLAGSNSNIIVHDNNLSGLGTPVTVSTQSSPSTISFKGNLPQTSNFTYTATLSQISADTGFGYEPVWCSDCRSPTQATGSGTGRWISKDTGGTWRTQDGVIASN